MERMAFANYLRAGQLNREMAAAVRYGKDTPRKTQLMRDFFAVAVAELDKTLALTKETTK